MLWVILQDLTALNCLQYFVKTNSFLDHFLVCMLGNSDFLS
jgi:hypothetical protein